jgi:ribose transport system permease protein
VVGMPQEINLRFDRFSGLYLWAAFILIFGIWTPHVFLTMATVHSVASSQSIIGIVALAALVPLTASNYDLSVGANANLAGVVAIVLQGKLHWAVVPAILLSVLIGFGVGCVNATIVTKLRINSFIATLGMSSILSAVEVIVTANQQPVPVTASGWNSFTQTSIFGFQIVVLYLLALALIIWWFLARTPGGRYLYAIGGNPEAARLSGVPVSRWTAFALIASGGIAGFAGILYTSLSGPALDFGSSLLLPAFAAAFLGSTQLQPGKFNVWGTVIAIYVLATGVEGLQLVSGQQWLSDMFNGVALITAVGLAVTRQRKVTRNRPGSMKARSSRIAADSSGSRGSAHTERTASTSSMPE